MWLNLWILTALIGSLLSGITVTAEKKLSTIYKDKHVALVYKYIFVTFFALFFLVGFSATSGMVFLPYMDLSAWLVLLLVGSVAYLWTFWAYKAFEKMCWAIVLIIIKLNVFLVYFVNIYLFNWPEALPWPQIVLAIIFFLIIAQFILQKRSKKTRKLKNINKNALYPLGVALCAVVFNAGTAWFVKSWTLSPIQTAFATETILLPLAVISYLILSSWSIKKLRKSWKPSGLFPLIVLWTMIPFSAFMFYYAFVENPANVVIFIALLAIVFTWIFGWIFLKDYLTKKQICLIIAAFAVLTLFVFVDDLLLLI